MTHLPYDMPIAVESCFGGMAIYDLQSSKGHWRDCFYAAHDDNDCEHVSFHNCLTSQQNWKMLLDPRMFIHYND